jgi:hypothetical protein
MRNIVNAVAVETFIRLKTGHREKSGEGNRKYSRRVGENGKLWEK